MSNVESPVSILTKSDLISIYIELRYGRKIKSARRKALESKMRDLSVESIERWIKSALDRALDQEYRKKGVRAYVDLKTIAFMTCPRSLQQSLAERLLPRLIKLEPNWNQFVIEFNDDRTLKSAVLNGPIHGDTNIESLVAEQMSNHLFHAPQKIKRVTFYNHRHRIELHVGRTEILFENCEGSLVHRIETNGPVIKFFVNRRSDHVPVEHEYTISRLKKEFRIDACHGQACGVRYHSAAQ